MYRLFSLSQQIINYIYSHGKFLFRWFSSIINLSTPGETTSLTKDPTNKLLCSRCRRGIELNVVERYSCCFHCFQNIQGCSNKPCRQCSNRWPCRILRWICPLCWLWRFLYVCYLAVYYLGKGIIWTIGTLCHICCPCCDFVDR